jgi:hypothetical protein
MRVGDLGGSDGWTLMLDPDPPHDSRWLDLTAVGGEPAVRIDLTPPPDTATVTVGEATADPGEHMLHAVAAWLLAAAVPQDTVPGLAALGSGPLPAVAGGLGDLIAALQAAGALSPLSPVPGQLAALCARLDAGGHGLTAPSARDLPELWLSVLAHYQRRKTRTAPAREGCVAAALTLPELDGITVSILGLHNCQGGIVVHAHASGPMCHHLTYRPAELYYWPVIWIRDSGGRWHTTCTCGQSGINDEVALRLEVVPPLSRGTELDRGARRRAIGGGSRPPAAALGVRFMPDDPRPQAALPCPPYTENEFPLPLKPEQNCQLRAATNTGKPRPQPDQNGGYFSRWPRPRSRSVVKKMSPGHPRWRRLRPVRVVFGR